MAHESLILLVTFEATAALFVALGIPLSRRRVRPNWLFGYRTPATLRDPELWYAVNARAGADLIGVGIVLGVLAAVTSAACNSVMFALLCTAWLLGGTLFTVVHGALYIRESRRAAPQR